MNPNTKEKKQSKTKPKTTNDFEASLIVFNDDINSFDHVINCFIEICELTHEIALKFAIIIHHTGSSVVKTGEFETMKKMKDKLVDCGLSAIVQRGDLN